MVSKPQSDNRKQAQVTLRLLKTDHEKIVSMFDKYEINSFNQLFDFLIGSGVVYLKPKIIEFVRDNIDKYKIDYKETRLKRKEDGSEFKKRDMSDYKEIKMFMYDSEYIGFNQFCLEEKYKKQWVFNVLFLDGFINERPVVVDFIKQCQKDKISEAKKQLAKEANLKYIKALEIKDCVKILKVLTQNYDAKKFADDIETQLIDLMRQEQDEKEKLKEEFNKIAHKLQAVRDTSISRMVEMRAKK